MRDNFLQRKKDVLLKLDKSSIGHWDEKIQFLCDKINSKEDFYTTSSCSGRIVLMIDKEEKESGLFIRIWHEQINFEELKKVLDDLIYSRLTRDPAQNHGLLEVSRSRSPTPVPLAKMRSLRVANILKNKINQKKFSMRKSLIKFKLEPPILHVACRNLKGASEFLEKAKSVGFRRSGINALRKNIVLELNSTERIEFPLISNGKILVDGKFLEIIVKQANEKLKKGWKKIEELKKLV